MDHTILERRGRLQQLVADARDGADVTRAALLLACEEYPELDLEAYHEQLGAWALQAGRRMAEGGGPLSDVVDVVNDILFGDAGLRGNDEDYYDPRNSFLNEVIDRRCGIPITLSLIYMHVATGAGASARGIGLPGHFVVGLQRAGEQVYVDPFHEGRPMSAADCQRMVEKLHGGRLPWRAEFLVPWSADRIMVRVLNNLKGIYLRDTNFEKALWVQDLLVMLAPDDPRELRDRGLINAQLAHYPAARSDLRAYLEKSPQRPEDAEAIERDLERLRRLHLMLN